MPWVCPLHGADMPTGTSLKPPARYRPTAGSCHRHQWHQRAARTACCSWTERRAPSTRGLQPRGPESAGDAPYVTPVFMMPRTGASSPGTGVCHLSSYIQPPLTTLRGPSMSFSCAKRHGIRDSPGPLTGSTVSSASLAASASGHVLMSKSRSG